MLWPMLCVDVPKPGVGVDDLPLTVQALRVTTVRTFFLLRGEAGGTHGCLGMPANMFRDE